MKFNKKIICIFLVILIPLLILLLENKESFSLGGQGRRGKQIRKRLKTSDRGRSVMATADKMSKKARGIKNSEKGRSVMATADKMSEKAEGMKQLKTKYKVGKAQMTYGKERRKKALYNLANEMITGGNSEKNATEVAKGMRARAKRRVEAKQNISDLNIADMIFASKQSEDQKSVAINIELNDLIHGRKSSVSKRLIRERLAQLAKEDRNRNFEQQNFDGKLVSRSVKGTEARISEAKKTREYGLKLLERRLLKEPELVLFESVERNSYNEAVDRAQKKFDERQKRGKRASGKFVQSAALGALATSTSGVGAAILGGAAVGYAADATYIAMRDKLRNRQNSKNFEQTKIMLKKVSRAALEEAAAAEAEAAVASVPISQVVVPRQPRPPAPRPPAPGGLGALGIP